jgi:hypothetical protein
VTGWDWLVIAGAVLLLVMAGKEVRALRGSGETLTHHIRTSSRKWVFVGYLAACLMFGIWAVLHFAEVIP